MESRSQEKFKGIPRSMAYNPHPPSRLNQLQESSSQQTLDQQLCQTNSHGQQELEHHMHEGPSNPDPDPSLLIATGLHNKATTQQVLPQRLTASAADTTTSIRYRECLKNHAASTGGYVVDGCGEFMPSGEEGTPEALKCAACNCHRNFHRKGIEGVGSQTNVATSHLTSNPVRHSRNSHRVQTQTPPPPYTMLPQQQHYRVLGGDSRAPAESSSEDLNTGGQALMQVPPSSLSGSKKRFRTKFTQQQKYQMHEFAEKIGWRIQKQDEQQVQQFCNEVGVKRQVFKVWMHNSKQAEKKRQM